MSTIDQNEEQWRRLRRWARLAGLLVTALWVLMAGGAALVEREPWTWEHWGIATMITLAVVVTAVAWWRPGLGGALMLVFALVFSLFAFVSAGRNELWAALITGGPYAVIGLLHLGGRAPADDRVIRPA